MKAIIKLNEIVELHIQITPEMKKDFAECEAMAQEGGECKDCDTCSLCNSFTSDMSLCEITEVAKILINLKGTRRKVDRMRKFLKILKAGLKVGNGDGILLFAAVVCALIVVVGELLSELQGDGFANLYLAVAQFLCLLIIYCIYGYYEYLEEVDEETDE